MRQIQFLILLTLPLTILSQQKQKVNSESIRVFYLGGQSNMDGHGYVSDLPNALSQEFKNVWIFHGTPGGDDSETGGEGIWEKLKPGHGTGFSSDGKKNKLSDRFGIELSFAKKLQNLYPNEKIAIIKYSRGGSSIDTTAAGRKRFGSWDPDYDGKTDINHYDHFLKTLNTAFETRDIDGNGVEDKLIPSGILWMQGESDAGEEGIASRYYDNLRRLMDLIRASFRTDDLPVAIGKISDSGNVESGKVWAYGELVQYAQEKLARTDNYTTIVRSTKDYGYSDPWHYDSESYIDLGVKFAEAITSFK